VDANEADTAFSTYDAVAACVAYDAVPNNEPVIPLCTFKLPVITVVNPELTCSIGVDPVHTVNSEPDTASSTSNNTPFDPLTANTVEPELYMFTLPVALIEPDMFTVWFN
jgi:hypothetical protein